MRVACVQANVAFADPEANIAVVADRLENLAGEGVDLAVFPEAFLTGYCVECLEDAQRIAIPRDRAAALQDAVDRHHISAVVGFIEAEAGHLYNTAALLEPGVPPRYYRKSHLPELGVDKFVDLGGTLDVFDTRHGRIGILICFDLRLPEPARVLALKGAEVIVLPTNWPEGAEASAEHVSIARAAENRVFIVTCNRVGEENGFRFIGKSKIIDPAGQVLAAAESGEETIVADIDPVQARTKRNVIVPGKFVTDMVGSRRPELYEVLGR